MKAKEALGRLGELARREGVEIRIEPLGLRGFFAALGGRSGRGGLCRIEGRTVILVDASLSTVEQAGVVGEALGSLELTDRHVPEDLHPYLATGHDDVRATTELRPIARARPR